MREERIQISLKAGHHWPPAEHNLNGVLLAGDGGPTLNAGLVAV